MARWFFLISFFGFFFWPVSLVFANGVVIEPAFQFVTIQGDQDQSSATIKLTNQSDSAQIYHLTTIDIRQLDETGRVGLVDKPTTDAQYSLAEYLQLPEQQIELEPGQSREVTVNVKNSLELSPGGHYGAVLAEVISQGNDGEQVVIPAVSAVLLVHKVGGERFHLNLKRVVLPEIWFSLPRSMQLVFENQGNVHVVPHGEVIISDVFNRRIGEGIINEGSLVVMPENQRVIGVNLMKRSWAIPFLPLRLSINGHAQPGDLVFFQSAVVGYLPILLLVGLLLGVTTLHQLIRRYGGKKR